MNFNFRKIRSRNIKFRKYSIGFITMLMMLTSVSTIMFFVTPLSADDPTASIWTTDEEGNPKVDFQPGDIVYIQGTGFSVGNEINIAVTRPDGSMDIAPGGPFPDYLPIVDEITNFSYEYDLDGILGNYTIVADDGTNTAETTFTDATYTVQTYSDPAYSTNKTFYDPGEPVYGKGVKKGSSHYLKLEYVDPSDNVVKTCLSSGKAKTITCDYSLPSNAEEGEWDLKFYTHPWTENPTSLKATRHFYVGIDYVENPELPGMCGIDMVLVLDSSGSIDSGELSIMQDAFKDFVDIFLPLTPTEMAVVDFDFNAIVLQDYTNDAGLLKAAIDSTESGGVTNWDDGLTKAHDTFPNRYPDKPTMYIFASDGNPNHWGDGSGGWDENQAIVEAIEQANIIKSDGVRILTLGIGDLLDDQRLKAISSDDAYYDVAGFEDLADVLYELVIELCGGTVIVKKLIDGVNASDWLFNAEVTGGIITPESDYTDEDGFIVFDVQLNDGVTTAYVNIIETLQPGYMLAEATAINRCTGSEVGTLGPNGIYNIPIKKVCIYYCEFNNTETPPPETTKEYGSPMCEVGDDKYITSHTPIYLNTTSYEGCYVIGYRIGFGGSWSPWMEGAQSSNVVFTLDDLGSPWNSDCEHIIQYNATDCSGKSEDTKEQTFHVDNIGPPAVEKEIGEPKYDFLGKNFVTTDTKIWLNASDPESDCEAPISKIRYIIRWDSDDDGVVDTEVADVTVNSDKTWFTFDEGCMHELEYWAIDCLGNEGTHETQTHYVDIEPPDCEAQIEFIGPHFERGGIDYISHDTIKRITVSDEGCNVGGAGVATIEWSVEDDGHSEIASGTVGDGDTYSFDNGLVVVTGDNDPAEGVVSIDISILEDCVHYIIHKGIDNLGNECEEEQEVRVDSLPPVVEKEVGKPSCEIEEGVYCVTNKTRIWINATDDDSNSPCTVGSVYLEVGIWYNNVWNINNYYVDDGSINVDFTFEEAGVGGDCIHYVTYTAKDNLDNILAEDNETFYVTSQGPKIFMDVGEPNCTNCGMGENEYCINKSTPIYINVESPETGCFCPGLTVEYSYDGGLWTPLPIPHTWYFGEECHHTLDVRAFDCLGEPVYVYGSFYVDETPPENLEDYKTVGEPHARLEDDPMGHHQWLVFKGTEINFTVPPDGGCCLCSDVKIEYRIWYWGSWSEWTEYTENITFNEGCMHYLEARAIDCLGNYGEIDNETFWVCGTGGYGDPINILHPTNQTTENSNVVEVIIYSHSDITPWSDMDVYLWVPGGRRDAPYLYYNVEPLDEANETYVAYVSIYNYQDGAQITLKAGAFDEYGNYIESLPVTFTVGSTVVWDQWMQYGWNPLPLSGGMPPGLDCNESLERVLSSAKGSYDWIFHYDPDEGWISYYTGRTSNELQEVEGGKNYWVHITNSNGIRYYIAMPEVEIQNPEDEAVISDEFPDEINGYAWDSQTGIKEVEIILYYINEEEVEQFWDGCSEWIDALFYLPCDLESYPEHYIQDWSYNCNEVNWIDEMTYYVYAVANDGFECYAISDISFFINLTKYNITGTITYEGEEEGYIFVELVDPSGPELLTYVFMLEPGPYTLMAPNGTYYVAAFMDLNGDTYFDNETEPAGLAINRNPYLMEDYDQIEVDGADWNNVDIILFDPPE